MTQARCTHAECDECGWLGFIKDLVIDYDRPTSEQCPECGSQNTWWLTKEEHDEKLKEYDEE